MAKAKTGTFYLTERISLTAAAADGSRFQGDMDLGAYVNVPTGQAIAIDQVDFIFQDGSTFKSAIAGMVAANGSLGAQVTDLNPGTSFVRADNQSLVASGCLNIDKINNVGTLSSDIYPDNHGNSSLSESFMVVNDSLYLVGGVDNTASGGSDVFITARIRCRVVKLGKIDWMAIAIQSTASDN